MSASERALELATLAAEAAADKLADNIVAIDVSERLVITDAFVLCSAPNDRQVRAIVDEVELRLRRIGEARHARANGKDAWCCWTTSTRSCTSSMRRSAASMRSSGCGRTAR